METTRLMFEVSGKISERYETGNFPEEKIIYKLNGELDFIENQIEESIEENLNEFGIKVSNIKVKLGFERGSVIVVGKIIIDAIDVIGKIAGVITFFDYFSRLINRIITKYIRKQVEYYIPDPNILIKVTPISIPIETSKSKKLFNISSTQLLLSITLINIAFFIGGTIFNTITIPSTIEKYKESVIKLREAKDDLYTGEQELKAVKMDYLLNLKELENEVFNKRTEIINSLFSDTIKINNEITILKNKVAIFNIELDSLSLEIGKQKQLCRELNSEIEKLKNKKINIADVWNFTKHDIRLILVICGILILGSLGLSICSVRKNCP